MYASGQFPDLVAHAALPQARHLRPHRAAHARPRHQGGQNTWRERKMCCRACAYVCATACVCHAMHVPCRVCIPHAQAQAASQILASHYARPTPLFTHRRSSHCSSASSCSSSGRRCSSPTHAPEARSSSWCPVSRGRTVLTMALFTMIILTTLRTYDYRCLSSTTRGIASGSS